MDVTVRAGDFAREMGLAARVASKRSPIPTVACVRLEAKEDGVLSIGATDLDVTTRSSMDDGVSVAKTGVAIVQAQRLADLAKSWRADASVRLHGEGAKLNVRADAFRGSLEGLPADDYPTLPALPTGAMETLPRTSMVAGIRRTRHMMSSEKNDRFFLDGIQLELKNGAFRLVAADGPRLVVVDAARTGTGDFANLIPRKAVDTLAFLLEESEAELEMSSDENNLFFRIGSRLLTSKQIDGKFPKYERIIPPPLDVTSVIPRAQLIAALKRALLVTSGAKRSVELKFIDGNFVISAKSAEVGDADETIEGGYVSTLSWTANGATLVDFLDSVSSENVELQLRDAKSAMKWTANEEGLSCLFVTMPLVD